MWTVGEHSPLSSCLLLWLPFSCRVMPTETGSHAPHDLTTWPHGELPCTAPMLKVASVAPPPWPCVLDRFCVLQIDRLISYGADVLNPVTLVQGEKTAVGTAVDYGYFKFYQVWLCSEQDPSETWLLLDKTRSPQSSLVFQGRRPHDGERVLWAPVSRSHFGGRRGGLLLTQLLCSERWSGRKSSVTTACGWLVSSSPKDSW